MEYLSNTIGDAYLGAINTVLSGGTLEFWAYFPNRNENVLISTSRFSDPAFNSPSGESEARQMEAYPISTALIDTSYDVPFPEGEDADFGDDPAYFEPNHVRFLDRDGLYLFRADFKLYFRNALGTIVDLPPGESIPEEFYLIFPIEDKYLGLHNSEVVVIRSMTVSIT